MAKEPYNWLDDPFDPAKEQKEQEEMRHAQGCGRIGFLAMLVLALVMGGALFFMSSLFTGLLGN